MRRREWTSKSCDTASRCWCCSFFFSSRSLPAALPSSLLFSAFVLDVTDLKWLEVTYCQVTDQSPGWFATTLELIQNLFEWVCVPTRVKFNKYSVNWCPQVRRWGLTFEWNYNHDCPQQSISNSNRSKSLWFKIQSRIRKAAEMAMPWFVVEVSCNERCVCVANVVGDEKIMWTIVIAQNTREWAGFAFHNDVMNVIVNLQFGFDVAAGCCILTCDQWMNAAVAKY